MNELIAAFSAGVLSMTSPCVLPLYPGFLAYLTGQAQGERRASPVLLGLLVLAGVVTMMLLLGALIAALALSVGQALLWITPLAYVVVIGLGLLMLFDRNPFLRMAQIQAPLLANPYANAFVYGLLYGPIALPCSGPLLVSIFALGLTAGEVVEQMFLVFVFGLGFGLPLFALALLNHGQQRRIVRLFTEHHRVVNLLAGLLLIGVGLFGLWQEWESIVLFWETRGS